jgi:hypothetical protein
MPAGEVPERYRDILASSALGHLATIGPDGRPQVNPVRLRNTLLSGALLQRVKRQCRQGPGIGSCYTRTACAH